MYSIYITHIQCIHYIILVKRRAKSCDPKTEIAVLNIMLYIYITSANCFIVHVLNKHDKIQHVLPA